MRPTLLILSLAAMLCGCSSRTSTTARKGRIIPLTDSIFDTGGTDTVRFGRLRSGEIAELKLWLSNESTHPVVIVSYERNCGCTTLDYDSQPFTPGDAQRVTLTFDSRGERGWQLKTLDISLAGARRPLRLFVEAEIE